MITRCHHLLPVSRETEAERDNERREEWKKEEVYQQDLALECRVPMILDGVVCAARKKLCDLRPSEEPKDTYEGKKEGRGRREGREGGREGGEEEEESNDDEQERMEGREGGIE
eukprot:754391-Hanusia_phi.AAC.1